MLNYIKLLRCKEMEGAVGSNGHFHREGIQNRLRWGKKGKENKRIELELVTESSKKHTLGELQPFTDEIKMK